MDRYFLDSEGETIRLRDIQGRYTLSFVSEDDWNSLGTLFVRDTDVFICSYCKSGNHWFWEVVTMLQKGDVSGGRDEMDKYMLDMRNTKMYDSFPSPRVFVSHRYYTEFPEQIKRRKIVYLLRNPKDICVSAYHHFKDIKVLEYNGSFNGFTHLFLEGKVTGNGWSEHIIQWSKVKKLYPEQDIMVFHYEDIHKFPHREIRRLAEFLEIPATDDLIGDIVRETEFSKMKARKGNSSKSVKFYKGGKEVIYRKGVPDDWRDWFTDDKARHFDNILMKQIEGVDLGILESVKRYFLHARL